MELNEKLLSARTVRDSLGGVSDMTIWRWQQLGILCQPTKINGRNYWPASAIQALIKPKAAA